MNTDQILKSARTRVERITRSSGIKSWQAPASTIKSVIGETAIPAETVLTAAWHDAPRNAFKQITLPTLFINKDDQTPRLIWLNLDLLISEKKQADEYFIPSWTMHGIPAEKKFLDSFCNARAAINNLDPSCTLWPDNAPWLIRWHSQRHVATESPRRISGWSARHRNTDSAERSWEGAAEARLSRPAACVATRAH